MRRHPLAGLGVAAVLGGVLLALVLALALGGGGDGGRAAKPSAVAVAGAGPLANAAAPAGDPRRPSQARPRRDVRGFRQSWLKAIGPVRIEARAPDPRGGPPFAVRVFAAQDMVEGRDGTLKPGGKPDRCAQLGRIHRGRFGWIDARNVFRPAGIVFRAAPILCGPAAADLDREPQIEVLNRMTDSTRSAARPLQSVVWGIAGAGASVDLRVDGRARRVAPAPTGAILVPLAPDPRRPEVRARVRYPSGPPVVRELRFGAAGDARLGLLARPGDRGRHGDSPPRPAAGQRPTLEYQFPDPYGGLPWGVVAAPTRHSWCVSQVGRVVGGRVTAWIDGALGTFVDAPPANGRSCASRAWQPTRRRPLSLTYGFGVGSEPPRGAIDRRARIERRATGSQTIVAGVAHPGVDAVTIANSTGVRTITPSRRAHAIVVVDEGGSPTDRLEISARMRDGTVYRAPSMNSP